MVIFTVIKKNFKFKRESSKIHLDYGLKKIEREEMMSITHWSTKSFISVEN